MPWAARLAHRASWSNHGYRRDPGSRRTSATRPAPARCRSARNSSIGCVECPTVSTVASVIEQGERTALVRGDVVGPVALDLVLRIVLVGPPGVTVVIEIGRVHPRDPAADAAGLGVPCDVIADPEPMRHGPAPLPWRTMRFCRRSGGASTGLTEQAAGGTGCGGRTIGATEALGRSGGGSGPQSRYAPTRCVSPDDPRSPLEVQEKYHRRGDRAGSDPDVPGRGAALPADDEDPASEETGSDVPPTGIEPATYGTGNRRSIR